MKYASSISRSLLLTPLACNVVNLTNAEPNNDTVSNSNKLELIKEISPLNWNSSRFAISQRLVQRFGTEVLPRRVDIWTEPYPSTHRSREESRIERTDLSFENTCGFRGNNQVYQKLTSTDHRFLIFAFSPLHEKRSRHDRQREANLYDPLAPAARSDDSAKFKLHPDVKYK